MLPHCRPRRASRRLPELRLSGHLLQLVSQSSLPQVSGASPRALAGGARTGTPGHQLFPRCLHRASRAECLGFGEPAPVLRSFVHGQHTNFARDRIGSETPRSPDRCGRNSAHLGTEPAPASPHSLCHSRGRAFTRSSSMGSSAISFLLTCQSRESCLSRQVSCCAETPTPPQQTTVCRSRCASRRSTAVCKTTPPIASPRLGGLRQTCFRRPHASVALPGSLHPSCGHFQSPLIGLRSRTRDFSLEGLCPRRQARSDDTDSDGVLAPLLSTRAAQGIRAHPSLRLSGESL